MPSPQPAPRESAPMTADGDGLPKYALVAAAVRRQIADGTLRPGQLAPSGVALSRVTGYSTLTCRRALRMLIADGVLVPGASRKARPRVAGVPLPAVQREAAGAARALSAGLAERRRAAGLTQPGLAALVGVSVTTIGHAETGRLWQSRRFWARADAALGARGELLRLCDAYRAVSASPGRPPRGGTPPENTAPPGNTAPPAGAALARALPGQRQPGDGGAAAHTGPAGRPAELPAGAMPCCIMVVWADGTVTLVRPPGRPAR